MAQVVGAPGTLPALVRRIVKLIVSHKKANGANTNQPARPDRTGIVTQHLVPVLSMTKQLVLQKTASGVHTLQLLLVATVAGA